MNRLKVTIELAREDGVTVSHTLDVTAGIPVIVDGNEASSEPDSAEASVICAQHISAALSPERLVEWIADLDSLPDPD